MGVVWRAVDERLERSVAIKQILAQPGLPEAERIMMRQRAMREAKNAARFQHPNAIVVFDIAEHGGDPCLVMEYLPSQSLSTILAEQEILPLGQVLKIGQQVASALVAAHRAGIVHRDIKPGNILIDEFGIAKITDFGISRATGDMTLTQTGLIGGTPAYLASELARGSDPSPASDVFSLGATLYQALEGEPPYGNNTNQLAVLYAAANGQINPPRKSGKATALIMQMLRTEPGERPSMSEVRDKLVALSADTPAPAMTLVAPIAVGSATKPPVTAAMPGGNPPWQRSQSNSHPVTMVSPAPARPNSGGLGKQAKKPNPPKANKKVLIGAIGAAIVVIAAVIFALTVNNDTSKSANPQSSQESSSAQAPPSELDHASNSRVVEFRPAGLRVVAFYDLPGGLAESWTMLTPAAQQVYGSQQAFEQYWRKFKVVYSASATGARNSDSSANITLTVTADSVQQKKTVRVIDVDGTLMIDSDTKLAGS